MRRDLNYFSKYHVAPAKASPLKLAAISAFAGIAAIMIVLIGFFQFSAMHLQGEIDRAEQTLKSPEMAQELKAVSDTEDKIVTVKNDELLFTSLEGDFRRLHRVNKAFMDFLNKKRDTEPGL